MCKISGSPQHQSTQRQLYTDENIPFRFKISLHLKFWWVSLELEGIFPQKLPVMIWCNMTSETSWSVSSQKLQSDLMPYATHKHVLSHLIVPPNSSQPVQVKQIDPKKVLAQIYTETPPARARPRASSDFFKPVKTRLKQFPSFRDENYRSVKTGSPAGETHLQVCVIHCVNLRGNHGTVTELPTRQKSQTTLKLKQLQLDSNNWNKIK